MPLPSQPSEKGKRKSSDIATAEFAVCQAIVTELTHRYIIYAHTSSEGTKRS
jgi:hypothetical protein